MSRISEGHLGDSTTAAGLVPAPARLDLSHQDSPTSKRRQSQCPPTTSVSACAVQAHRNRLSAAAATLAANRNSIPIPRPGPTRSSIARLRERGQRGEGLVARNGGGEQSPAPLLSRHRQDACRPGIAGSWGVAVSRFEAEFGVGLVRRELALESGGQSTRRGPRGQPRRAIAPICSGMVPPVSDLRPGVPARRDPRLPCQRWRQRSGASGSREGLGRSRLPPPSHRRRGAVP